MKGKISTGIWFIFFGIIALLHNFNVIRFNFWAVVPYWPLLVISLGANLIFQNKRNGVLALTVINIGLCIFLAYVGTTSNERFNINNHISINTSGDTTGAVSWINSPYTEDIENVKLNLNIGAIALNMDTISTPDLIHARSSDNIGLQLSESEDGPSKEIEINSVIKNKSRNGDKITFALNENPIWDIEVNMGAATLNADFRNHQIANLVINAGAASINLTLGMPVNDESAIEINSAASTCKLFIPDGVACRIDMSTILSSKKLEGFEKVGNYYQTPNYDHTDKKYIINFTGAANSLKINSY